MQRLGLAVLAVLTLAGGHLEQAGAGSKFKKQRGCGGCSSPVSNCASPYAFGCSSPGCFAPTCSLPVGCSRPVCSMPSCAGGCSGGVYGCASSGARPEYAPYVYLPNPTYSQSGSSAAGCGGSGSRPEYAPYVYQPNPYVNMYGVGAPVSTTGTPVVPQSSSASYPLLSAYNAPVAPSMPTIPPLPPAEDVVW